MNCIVFLILLLYNIFSAIVDLLLPGDGKRTPTIPTICSSLHVQTDIAAIQVGMAKLLQKYGMSSGDGMVTYDGAS
jgi:hypothetical protein